MRSLGVLVDAVEGEAFGELTGVLHIGIGGSVLGPALLVCATEVHTGADIAAYSAALADVLKSVRVA